MFQTIMPFRIRRSYQKLISHISFFFDHELISKKEFFLALILSAMLVATETLGLAMTYPILTFIETGGDAVLFEQSSKINHYILSIFELFDMEINLLPLMLTTFLLINLRQGINYWAVTHNEGIKWGIGKRLGKTLISIFLNSSSSFNNNIKSGDLTALVDYESQATASIMQTYISIWQITISFIFFFSLIVVISPIPTLLLILFLGLTSLLLRKFIRKSYIFGEKSVKIRSDILNFISERFSAWKTIKIYNASEIEITKFDDLASQLMSIRLNLAKITEKMALIFVPIAIGSLFLLLYILVEFLEVKVGILMMFGLIMLRLIPIAQSYQKKIAQLARFDASLKKVLDILSNSAINIEHVNIGKNYKPFSKHIVFKNVSFKHLNSSQPSIKNVSFKIPSGKFTGIIGASGSGKTTILDMICGFKIPTSGQVLFDELSIKKLKLNSLRKEIAYLGQEPFLFDDTIKANLLYSNPCATDEMLEIALSQANLWNFVKKLPDQLNTHIGSQGSKLSVGQKQRLAVARTLLSNASIILLDEPTSALDNSSESQITKTINLLNSQQKTIIVVAHRLNTIAKADLIIHMENGVCVDQGTPQVVLENFSKIQKIET